LAKVSGADAQLLEAAELIHQFIADAKVTQPMIAAARK